jgi:NAD(P)-dependent dehydrogenase (short-subunit alcohol dehydrogenase family)
MSKTALIVGAGDGISAAVARRLALAGYRIALSARTLENAKEVAQETEAALIHCDVTDAAQVTHLFEAVEAELGVPDVVLFNPSARSRGPLVELDAADVETALRVTAYGGFLVAQQAARRMLEKGSGTILFTGASASVKGYAQSAPFAMGKFALRGLAQSMARELHPQNIHVAHFVIDGAVRNEHRGMVEDAGDVQDKFLDPDAIAHTYVSVINQPRSAWTWEVELRPWVEKF